MLFIKPSLISFYTVFFTQQSTTQKLSISISIIPF